MLIASSNFSAISVALVGASPAPAASAPSIRPQHQGLVVELQAMRAVVGDLAQRQSADQWVPDQWVRLRTGALQAALHGGQFFTEALAQEEHAADAVDQETAAGWAAQRCQRGLGALDGGGDETVGVTAQDVYRGLLRHLAHAYQGLILQHDGVAHQQ